jgi:hypothetical protein
MTIPEKWLKVFNEEQRQYEAWQRGEQDMPAFVDASIVGMEKMEAYCQMAEERVRDEVIFDRKKIVEILSWD